jgi:HD-GYP domain-containing protein (c-di-GMP phosphodiesterase class II)
MSQAKTEYFPFPIGDLVDCEKNISFTVYIRIKEGKYVAVFTPHSGIDKDRLSRYCTRIEKAYIHVKEKVRYESFTNNKLDEILEEDEAVEDKSVEEDPQYEKIDQEKQKKIISAVVKLTEKNLSQIFMPKNVTEEEIQQTKLIVKGYINVLSKDPSIVMKILASFNKSNYLSFHSLATSTLSIFLCRMTKHFSSRLLEVVGMGGMLHDMGKVQVELDGALVGYSDELSKDPLMQQHPSLGFNMVEDLTSISEEVKMIIAQHHERPDGNGYPKGLKDTEIYLPASIISASNAFVNYISRKPYGLGLSPHRAVQKMRDAEGCFNDEFVQCISKLYAK